MATTASPSLTFRTFTLDEIQELPKGTILAMTWPNDPEPGLFRRTGGSESRLPWALLTAPPGDFEWEQWSHDEVYSEYALYAVFYLPGATPREPS